MPPQGDAPDCIECGWYPADEDGYCSDGCFHIRQERLRKEGSDGKD